ncbi:MAG: AI-2E family transporter [Candidatus Niyogibacteria bacterium]|nr:AI-2E family transporter [Candidatus Niyogibacteria bacterium]
MPQFTKIDISTNTLVRAAVLVLILIFLFLVRNIIALVLFAVVIASAVEPAARWFTRYRIPHVLGVLLVYIIAFGILAGAFSVIIPQLFTELSQLSAENLIRNASGAVFNLLPAGFPFSLSQTLEQFVGGIQASIGAFTGGFVETATTIFGGALSFVLIIVLSFYLSVQKDGVESFLKIVTPKEYEPYVIDLWDRSRQKIGWWLRSQILLGLLIGALVYIGLAILRVKFALSFAVLAAIFELIPVFGPVMASIPAIIIAFLQGPTTGLGVLIFYFIVQQFENHLIVPLVFKKAVGVPPILVVVSMIVGGQLGGIFGLLLAVPLAAVLVEFSNDIATRKRMV